MVARFFFYHFGTSLSNTEIPACQLEPAIGRRRTLIVNPQSVYFDLYSTLIFESATNPFYDRVAADLDVDKEVWLRHYGKRKYESMSGDISGMDQRVYLSLADAGYQRSEGDVTGVVEKHFPSFIESVGLYADTITTLERLRELDLPLGLISNASDHSVAIFESLGLSRFFDSVVFSFQHRCLKPDPRIYQVGLADLRQTPSNALYVGDGGDQELRGARELGFSTVLLDRGLPHTEAARLHADHVITDLASILGIVDSLQSAVIK